MSAKSILTAAFTFPVILAVALGAGSARAANLLTNGSFEMPVVSGGGGKSFYAGSDGIPGWTVVGPTGTEVAIGSGTLTVSGFNFPAEDGHQWLDLTGANSNNLEGVSQTVPTTPGTTYTLTFWVGNISGLGGKYSSAGLKINGTPAGNYTNSTPGSTLNWQNFTYSFIATSSTTAIEFDNLDPITDNSNGLDNVDLEEGGTASPLPVNLITNGDFETPVLPAGGGLNVSSGSSALTGWTVIGTAPLTVALVSGACTCGGFNTTGLTFPAEDGHQWLDLTGTGYSTGTRGITQTVATVAGTTYELTFWVGNIFDPDAETNPGCCNFGTTSTVGLKINGTEVGSYTNSARVSVMNWQQFGVTFTATGDSTVIEFDNLDPATDSSNGLDNVVLEQTASAVPLVSTVIFAGAFGGFASAAPGSWIEIYGSGLASNTRGWTSSDFNGVNAPTSLDGTSVSIGGQAAFIDYISPGQVNAQVPSSVGGGPQQLIVTNRAAASVSYTVIVSPTQPGLLAPASFHLNGTQYAVAILDDGSYALPTGAISGVSSRPAKPGETIVLYGVGFGSVSPDIAAGQIVQQSNTLASSLQVSIGGHPATVAYAGLAPNFVGLYQFNITVPDVNAGDAVPLKFTLGGLAGIQPLNIAVGN
jgi:uncharacterized protein (TIGR03437 family)